MILYLRMGDSKTILDPAAHTHIAHILEYPTTPKGGFHPYV